MTLMKRLSAQRRRKIKNQIEKALLALDMEDEEVALRAIDTSMKLFNGWDDSTYGTMRYDELHDACEAFLEQTGFCSLSSLLTFIKHWQKREILADLGKAAYDAECDMTHYWRCDAWQTEAGKRRSTNPPPSDEKCSCGLKGITALVNKVYEAEKE